MKVHLERFSLLSLLRLKLGELTAVYVYVYIYIYIFFFLDMYISVRMCECCVGVGCLPTAFGKEREDVAGPGLRVRDQHVGA